MAYKVPQTSQMTPTERMYLPELVRGIFITAGHFLRNLFGKRDPTPDILERQGISAITTVEYPEEKVPLPPGYRGLHRLVPREDGRPRCVACYMCATVCPAQCIYIEAGEWLAWQLSGVLARSTCHGGYKQCWHKREGYPSAGYLKAVHPELPKLVSQKMPGERVAPGKAIGGLTPAWAKKLGLPAGIAVSSSIIDAHSGVPGAGIAADGVLAIVMGTSSCHMLMDKKEKLAKGISGVVEDGILPGLYGYEAGQVAVGDIFAWYVNQCAPAYVAVEAAKRKISVHEYLTAEAAKLKAGQNRLIALDWWNGNRTPFVDANLSGVIVGLTLGSKPAEIYRALLEATAYGTLRVIEAFETSGVKVKSIVGCGGIAQKNPLIMQIYSDVTGRPIDVAGSPNASSLGAAILGAVAAGAKAGGYDNVSQAARRMVPKPAGRYTPNKAANKIYAGLYNDYRRLSELFGRYKEPVMKNLRSL